MKFITVFLFLVLAFSNIFCADGRQGYYRFPALHEQTVVFTSEGDLWSVDIHGGTAKRLTTNPGMESNAAISPDGVLIAFSGQYDGPTEVYTMPLNGGLPQRRTFMGQTSTVVGWTAANKILYSTKKYSTLPNTQLLQLDPQSGQEELLPLAQASDGTYDPTGKTLYFTRLAFQGSYTKRYKGGTAQNIWKFSETDPEAVPMTADYPGTSKNPMFWQGRIYFVSDRDGTMNIWSMNPQGGDLQQHTLHKNFDVSSPSLQAGIIVYQLVADLYYLDIRENRSHKIAISLVSDFEQTREKWLKKPQEYLTAAHLSPDGERVVLTSRGQVFTVASSKGRLVRVSKKEGIRRRSSRFLPDGKNVMFLADESGEWEFYRQQADGTGQPERITSGAQVIRFDGLPSRDGKWLAFGDKDYKLWIYNIEQKKAIKIASSLNDMFNDFSWSPDSKWLAFVQSADNLFSQIMLYQLETGKIVELTSNRVDSFNPVWSPDGKWIYFLSDRYFKSIVSSPWGPRQPEPFFNKTTKLYAIALTAQVVFPFQPADELNVPAENKERLATGNKKTAGKALEESPATIIECKGIQERIFELPVAPGIYSNLALNDKIIFFNERESAEAPHGKLQALEIKSQNSQAKTIFEDIRHYELSLDGKKILVQKADELYVFAAAATPLSQLEEKKVDLSKWMFSIDPRQEWRQMFGDAWRMERDYFYDRNLHGVDYEGLFKRHQPFLERIGDRYELNDLLAHLVGELSALHTFVRGGDLRRNPDEIPHGSLGARLECAVGSGGYRITHIYKAAPEYPEKLSPLSIPMLGVQEGDIICAINGASTLAVANPLLLLRNTAGQQVLLEVKSAASSRLKKIIVYPISLAAEDDLRYEEWEYTRRLAVEKAGKGDIGYIHLRAMGNNNYTEWVKNFYPVFNCKGLIIDVRNNRGGNIDSWILEKLLRKAWFYWQSRVGNPTWNMQYAFRGHLVVICNESTASDGEAFAEGFRRLGLGKVIGTRTWGGEIWLSMNNTLVDRGIASAAEMGVFGPEGAWLIEGHGVEPDIVVDNLPHATFRGKDAQLEVAIRELQEKIRLEPVEIPAPPPFPKKSVK